MFSGTTFQRALRRELLARGWQLDVLLDDLTHDETGLRMQFLSGKAVMLSTPGENGGGVFSSGLAAPDEAAGHVADQIDLFILRRAAARRAVEEVAADLKRRLTEDETSMRLLGVPAANQ